MYTNVYYYFSDATKKTIGAPWKPNYNLSRIGSIIDLTQADDETDLENIEPTNLSLDTSWLLRQFADMDFSNSDMNDVLTTVVASLGSAN